MHQRRENYAFWVRILSMRYVAPEDQSKERAPGTVIHGRGNIVPIDVRKSLLD